MTPIPLHIRGPGIRVKGELFADSPLEHLDEDILQVSLPNGLTVDVGWYPACDEDGAFKVVVYRGHWRNQLFKCATRDPRAAAKAVESLVSVFRRYAFHTTASYDIPSEAGAAQVVARSGASSSLPKVLEYA